MFNKEKNSSCHHGALGLIMVLLFSCLLLVLVFIAGMMAGGVKSHYSECKLNKSFGKNMDGKYLMDKKLYYKKMAANYQLVTEMTEAGFKVKDGSGKVYEVVIDEETKIYKGEEGGVIQVGDKVYIEGEVEDEKYKAKLIKAFDASLKK